MLPKLFIPPAVAGLLSLCAVSAIPTSAFAGDRDRHDYRAGHDRGDRYRRDDQDLRRDHDRDRDRDKSDFRIDLRIGNDPFCEPPPRHELRETRVWVEPVDRTVHEKVWVEPVYRSTYDRVWVEPVYREENERIWIPDRYEYRECVEWEYGRRVVRRERVLVEPGHWDIRTHRVLVCEGRWENVERQELVCAGRWEYVERQECLTPGHWETRVERVAVHDRPLVRGNGIDVYARFGR
jgi:hypothetical protein